MNHSSIKEMLNRFSNFLSNNVWAGISGVFAIIAIGLTVYIFCADSIRNTANIDYWIINSPSAVRLPSGVMTAVSTNALWIGVRNNGPSVGEGVLVSIESSDSLTCLQVGQGLNLADTQKPTRDSVEPFICEYYYDYFYNGYYLFFIVDHPSKNEIVRVNVSGKNIKSIDKSPNFK